MLPALLAKDLRRAWRNPLPWVINLIVPLVLTGLIGLVFGGGNNGALGKIHFAVVNENRSWLSRMLRGAVDQQSTNQFLDPIFMERAEALREIDAGRLSAVFIIPTNFLSDYLTGQPVSLELIKNPAESIHPAVLEEMFGVVVAAMNGVSHNFGSEFANLKGAAHGDYDYHDISSWIDQAGDKFKRAKDYLDPPLVTYDRDATEEGGAKTNAAASAATSSTARANTNSMSGIFAFLLLGLAAMFLLFIAGSSMADLHREISLRTFARFQTLRVSPAPFLLGKILFTALLVMACAAIVLGGGGWIFGIHWERPLALAALVAGYAGFMAAWFALLAAILPDERRVGMLSSLSSMALGLIGGCTFPPDDLPGFLRDYVTPWMPSFWFADTARNLQGGGTGMAWAGVLLQLIIVSIVLVVVAAVLFRRRFSGGLRS